MTDPPIPLTLGPPRYFLAVGAWRGLTRETVGYVEVTEQQAAEAKGPVMLEQKEKPCLTAARPNAKNLSCGCREI